MSSSLISLNSLDCLDFLLPETTDDVHGVELHVLSQVWEARGILLEVRRCAEQRAGQVLLPLKAGECHLGSDCGEHRDF